MWRWLLSNSQKSKTNPEFLHQPVRNNLPWIGIINAISNHFSLSKTGVPEAVWWPVKLGMSSLEKLSFTEREKPPVPHTQKTEEDREQPRNTPQGNFCFLHACTQTANPKQADTQMKARNYSDPRTEYKAKLCHCAWKQALGLEAEGRNRRK